MVRFCENTYGFVGILGVIKQGVALGTKESVRSDVHTLYVPGSKPGTVREGGTSSSRPTSSLCPAFARPRTHTFYSAWHAPVVMGGHLMSLVAAAPGYRRHRLNIPQAPTVNFFSALAPTASNSNSILWTQIVF
jgi:hypothetical protein